MDAGQGDRQGRRWQYRGAYGLYFAAARGAGGGVRGAAPRASAAIDAPFQHQVEVEGGYLAVAGPQVVAERAIGRLSTPPDDAAVVPDDVARPRLVEFGNRGVEIAVAERAGEEVLEAGRIGALSQEIEQWRGRIDEQRCARRGIGLDELDHAACIRSSCRRYQHVCAGQAERRVWLGQE